jgi:hypothetical protein
MMSFQAKLTSLLLFLISSEFYKKRKGAPKHTESIQKDTKTGKRGEGEKTPGKPKQKETQKTPTKPLFLKK